MSGFSSGFAGEAGTPWAWWSISIAFIESAGAENVNDRCYVTFGGLPPEELVGAGKIFFDKYKARYGRPPLGNPNLICAVEQSGLTGPLERFLQRHSRERQPLSWEQRQELIPRFESDIAKLEEVLGESFRDWIMPRERSGGMVGGRPTGQGQARNGRPDSQPQAPSAVP